MRQLLYLNRDRCPGMLPVLLLCVAMLLPLCWSPAASGQEKPDIAVQRAFQLRMDGKVDEARKLLEKHVEKEPGNALGQYELARIYMYMMTGNPRNMKDSLEKAGKAIGRAVEIEPENALYRYSAAGVQFLNSYMALNRDQQNVKKYIGEICEAYESLLEMMPDHAELLLGLVELYGAVPEDMGRDEAKAGAYAERVARLDPVLGFKAHCLIMPEDFDHIGYWENLREQHPGDARILEEVGKTYLRQMKSEKGIEYLREAMNADPARTTLHLDIARHHVMKLWQGMGDKGEVAAQAIEAVKAFLATDPIVPLKAYAQGMLANLYSSTGNSSEAGKWKKEAEATDAYYSKASAIPSADLFVQPGVMPHNHSYMFRPM